MSADRYGIPSTKIIELMKNLQVPFRNVGAQHKIMVMTDTAMAAPPKPMARSVAISRARASTAEYMVLIAPKTAPAAITAPMK